MLNFDKSEDLFKNKSRVVDEKKAEEIKLWFPELKKWKNSSINNLWKQYSLAMYMTENPLWIKNRENALLGFIYMKEKYDFNFGTEGMFEDYLKNFAQLEPWVNVVDKPKWINYTFLTE